MIRYLLDTNVLIRFLTHDDAAQAAAADDLFRRAAGGEVMLVLTEAVVIESVWVLTSAYGLERPRIAEVLSQLLINGGVECVSRDSLLSALRRFAESSLDVVDCHLVPRAADHDPPDAVASFDSALIKLCNSEGVGTWDRPSSSPNRGE